MKTAQKNIFFDMFSEFSVVKIDENSTEIRVNAYGNVPTHVDLEDVVKIYSAVSYQKYLELVSASPVLLLVISSEHNLFMPSKIVDYFGANRPILAYVPRGSEMRNVLQKAGMSEQTIDDSDVSGGIQAIESLWQSFSSNQLNSMDASTEQWSSEVQLPRYVELLKGLPVGVGS